MLRLIVATSLAAAVACGPPPPEEQTYSMTAAYRADLLLDHYAPRDAGVASAVVVLVHGCCGDRRDLAGLARALAVRGATVVNADVHALADGGGWPATYVDVVSAYAWGLRSCHRCWGTDERGDRRLG